MNVVRDLRGVGLIMNVIFGGRTCFLPLQYPVVVVLYFVALLGRGAHAADPVPLVLGHITPDDQKLMKKFFESHISDTLDDPAKAYHVALGLSSLGFSSEGAGSCQFVGRLNTPQAAFQRTSIAKLTGSAKCKVCSLDFSSTHPFA